MSEKKLVNLLGRMAAFLEGAIAHPATQKDKLHLWGEIVAAIKELRTGTKNTLSGFSNFASETMQMSEEKLIDLLNRVDDHLDRMYCATARHEQSFDLMKDTLRLRGEIVKAIAELRAGGKYVGMLKGVPFCITKEVVAELQAVSCVPEQGGDSDVAALAEAVDEGEETAHAGLLKYLREQFPATCMQYGHGSVCLLGKGHGGDHAFGKQPQKQAEIAEAAANCVENYQPGKIQPATIPETACCLCGNLSRYVCAMSDGSFKGWCGACYPQKSTLEEAGESQRQETWRDRPPML